MDAKVLLVSPDQMRAIDAATIEEIGIPGMVLMERAALGACAFLRDTFPTAQSVCVICGPGNNGGDGLAMARMLAHDGLDVHIVLAAEPERFTGDAEANLHICARLGFEFFTVDALEELEFVDVFVDAVLGTGIDRMVTPDSLVGRAISFLSEHPDRVFSVDIPSGVHGRSGQPAGLAVRAQATATFGLPKLGVALEPGRDLCGALRVVDIGIPFETVEDIGWEAVWLTEDYLHVPLRPAQMHKGDAGRVVVLGGTLGHTGAALLAARGALARGAGLITVATDSASLATVAVHCPELMALDRSSDALVPATTQADVLVAGPGLGTSDDAIGALQAALNVCRRLVLDADGLNLLADQRIQIPPNAVITPHPGEAARLLGCEIRDVLINPIQAAVDLAIAHQATVVLKGASTVVVSHDGRIAINRTGNPGMATGGMGDALAGIIGASLCESDDLFEACCHSVCLHGYAGDQAATLSGQRGLTVTNLLSALTGLWPDLEVK
ncbi:MAG: NAD(P)H-hydrate dehydratase [bacterium]